MSSERVKLLLQQKRTLLMGIVNVTPDSFSDGGKYHTIEKAVAHARHLAEEGADMLDIGGESTRAGATFVSESEELERIIPVIHEVAKEVDLPISVDTYKANVAKQAIGAGASLINDIWGAQRDSRMASTMAELQCPVILMHNRQQPCYHSLMEEIQSDLLQSVRRVKEAGVNDPNIILDPGIGFGKNYKESLLVMKHLEVITQLGYPVLLGTSRKSIIGNTLDLPPEDRLEGTAATVALGIAKGCRIMRVHDVKEMSRVSRMMDAMLQAVE